MGDGIVAGPGGGADRRARDGGGWHHLVDGGLSDEVTAARGVGEARQLADAVAARAQTAFSNT